MEYNERGKPLKRLSSLTNPKSAGLIVRNVSHTQNILEPEILVVRNIKSSIRRYHWLPRISNPVF